MSAAADKTVDEEIVVHDPAMQAVLGPFSSHPKGMQWRSRVSFAFALILTGWLTWQLVPLLSFHHAKGILASFIPKGLFTMLVQSSSALPQEVREFSLGYMQTAPSSWADFELWRWFAIALLASLLVAAGLSDRWAAFQAKKLDMRGCTAGERWPFPVGLALLFVLLVFALPAAAFVMNWLPVRWEIFLDLALVTLLWSLLAWAALSNPSKKKRRFLYLAGAAALWAVPLYNFATGFFSYGLGSWLLAGTGFPALPPVALPPGVEMGMLNGGLAAFLAWIFLPKKPRKPDAAEEKKEQQLDHRAVVEEILAGLSTPHRVVKPLDEVERPRVSDISASPSFWPVLMGGVVPTVDQVTFLEKHRTGSLEFARRVQDDLQHSDWWNGFNLLLAGTPGSGRTSALIAAALYSAVAGGTVSLVIAPRPDKRRWLAQRIGETLRAVGLHTHFNCEELTAGGVRTIIESGRPAPSVLVATPQDLEDHLFGLGRMAEDPSDAASVVKSRDQNSRLEALFASMPAVFVENLSDFDPVPRSHLAFQLEKLRLHLAARGRGMVAVVVAPPVEGSAAATLGTRLFGETGFRPDRDVVSLRPPPLEKTCLAIELDSSAPAGLAEEITGALLKKNLATVLFRKGIDEESCAEQQRKLAAAGGGGRLVVLGDLDQQFDGSHDFDSVVYQNLTTMDATVAVGLRFGGETTVVFHVRPDTSSLLIEPESTAMPVLAGRESPPLVSFHSVSLWSGLDSGDNIEEDWMKRLMPRDAGSSSQTLAGTPLVELRIVPPAPHTDWANLVALDRASPAAFQPVGTAAIPDDTLASAAGGNDTKRLLSFLRRAAPARANSTRLLWVSAAGQDMGRWPVENSPVLLLHSENGTFAAASVKRQGDAWAVAARHYNGSGDDLLMAAVQLSWQLPPTARLEAVGGGPDFGASWFRVLDGSRTVSFEVEGELSGLVSERGLVSAQTPAPFRFPASASLVFIGHDSADPSHEDQWWRGPWQTRHTPAGGTEFSYETTAAFSRFVCSDFNGPANFCWPAAFRGTKGTLLWLLEPANTGPSFSSMMFDLLATAAFREKLFPLISDNNQSALDDRLPPAPRIGTPGRAGGTQSGQPLRP